jgi:AbrB family looped-hinge helix DNA binding protein
MLGEKTMEDLIKVREKGQITLPLYMRRKLHLEQGDLILAKIVDNTLVLIPQEIIDKDQAWFWSERWQKMESEAEQDIRKGRVMSFDSVKELFDDIDKAASDNEDKPVRKKRP